MTMTALDRFANRLVVIGLTFLVIPLLVFCMWSVDRKAPFELVSYSDISVVPGDSLVAHEVVRRDVSRNCSATFARYTMNSRKEKGNESPVTYMNARAIENMSLTMGVDKLDLTYPISDDMPLGQASLVTVLDYRCNPLHYIWPIQVVTVVPFNVIPKN